MGLADYVWTHPSSFKRRRKEGEETVVRFEGLRNGFTAFDASGEQLFSLTYTPAFGYKMLDRSGEPALMTRPGTARDCAFVEDRKGRHLTTLEKEEFVWDGSAYAWKPQAALALNGETTYELRSAAGDQQNGVLATLRLPGGIGSGPAELKVQGQADREGLPLGLLIFQAMIIEHQWGRSKMLAPLKRLSFTSKWV